MILCGFRITVYQKNITGQNAVPVPVTDASTRYSLTANAGENANKITAARDRDLPAGGHLEVQRAPPDGNATSSRQAVSSRAEVLCGFRISGYPEVIFQFRWPGQYCAPRR